MSSLSQSTPVVTLYQPTLREIDAMLARAFRAQPSLTSRIMKARGLLLDGALRIEPVRWHKSQVAMWQVESQGERGFYTITGGYCTCPDRNSCMVAGRKFCKHTIALCAYKRILRDKLNADIRTFDVQLSMLPNGELHAYAPKMGYVQVRNVNGTYHFVNESSLVHYSLWLARSEKSRQPIATEVLAVAA